MEDNKQFCLKWNDHQSTLIQNFDILLESGTLTDCTIASEGKYIKAHRVVLSACSPYLEGLLSEHFDKHPVLILKDVKFKFLKAMMDYMYRGEVNINEHELTALLKAAESLQIKGLSNSQTDANTQIDTRETKISEDSSMTTNIPHNTSSDLIIEKKNKTRKCSLVQDSVNESLNNNDSSQSSSGKSSVDDNQSTIVRERLNLRRRRNNDNNSVQNHLALKLVKYTNETAVSSIENLDSDKRMVQSEEINSKYQNIEKKNSTTQSLDEITPVRMEKLDSSGEQMQPKFEILDITENDEDVSYNYIETEQISDVINSSNPNLSEQSSFEPWYIADESSNASKANAPISSEGTDEVFLAAIEAQDKSQNFEYCNMPSDYFHLTNDKVQQGNVEHNKRFKCQQCPKSFRYARGLWQHTKHECFKKPRFKCPYCMFCCKNSSNIYTHIRLKHFGMSVYYIDLYKEKAS